MHGQRIDFGRPNNLVYATIGGKQSLVALAYIVRKAPNDPLPSGFSGLGDIWHVHDGEKFLNAVRESYPLIGRLGQRWFSEEVQKLDGRSQLAMVHLWLIPNPKGMFATHNPELVYRDLGLPRRWASTDMEIARGLALSTSRGCRDALDAELWIAGASRSKKRTLMRACEAIAADVRDPLGTPEARLESRAKAEWRRLEDMKLMTLSAAELRRIDAFVEDGPGICR